MVKTVSLYVGAGLALSLLGAALGFPLVCVFLFFAFFAYLKVLSLRFDDRNYNFLALGFLFVLGIASAELISGFTTVSPYFVPVSIFTMLVSLLYRDLELSLVFGVILSLWTGATFGGDLHLVFTLLLGSVVSSLLAWPARRRSTLITAGFSAGIVQALAVLSFFKAPSAAAFGFCAVPFLNGILSSFVVAGVLPVFEYLFKVVTNVSLLELADFNHPLLKRLVLEAPGTYHHSLMVGNLAEMACEAIGANSLLARVGAYYHDIGKLEKPEYFSENQERGGSKHEELSASMSKLVIMDHVRSGAELARKNRINEAIIEFIHQHHGTSLVYYFYKRALESELDKDSVTEEVFRYPGPKPQSKETAIVLLADSVEAACRALEDPTAGRISDLVRRLINNKFIDGQLDTCDLTLKDLDKIATTFIHILGAFYHSRIEYPDQDKGSGR